MRTSDNRGRVVVAVVVADNDVDVDGTSFVKSVFESEEVPVGVVVDIVVVVGVGSCVGFGLDAVESVCVCWG